MQTLPTAQATPALTDSFSWGHDPLTHACKARPLTIVVDFSECEKEECSLHHNVWPHQKVLFVFSDASFPDVLSVTVSRMCWLLESHLTSSFSFGIPRTTGQAIWPLEPMQHGQLPIERACGRREEYWTSLDWYRLRGNLRPSSVTSGPDAFRSGGPTRCVIRQPNFLSVHEEHRTLCFPPVTVGKTTFPRNFPPPLSTHGELSGWWSAEGHCFSCTLHLFFACGQSPSESSARLVFPNFQHVAPRSRSLLSCPVFFYQLST